MSPPHQTITRTGREKWTTRISPPARRRASTRSRRRINSSRKTRWSTGGVQDVLDEGYSPPDRPLGLGAYGPPETMDQLLAEEEPDPAARLNVLLDDAELCRSDAAEQEAEFPPCSTRWDRRAQADLSHRTRVSAATKKRS